MADQNVGDTENIGRRGKSLDELRRQRSEVRQSQTYKSFLKDLCRTGGWDEQKAEKAAVSVLCLLEQRIVSGEAADLEAQLPRKLVSLLNRCERHENLSQRDLNAEKFLELVAEDMGTDKPEAETILHAVFQTLRERVDEGEIEQVINQLPADLRMYWQPSA